MFDVVHRRGRGTLVVRDDAVGHLLRQQPGVIPHRCDDWDVDARKDIRGRLENGEHPHDEHEESHDSKRIGPLERELDNPHRASRGWGIVLLRPTRQEYVRRLVRFIAAGSRPARHGRSLPQVTVPDGRC